VRPDEDLAFRCREGSQRLGFQVPAMKRILALVGLLAIFAAVGQAQGRGMMSAAPRSFAPAPRSVAALPMAVRPSPATVARAPIARAGASVGVRPTVRTGAVTRVRTPGGAVRFVRRVGSPTRRVQRQDFASEDGFADDTNAVPGLGFDFVHFAATHPNAFRHHHNGFVGGFFPFFSSGFAIPSVPTVVDEEAPIEETEEVVEQAPRRVRVVAPQQAQAPVASPAVEAGPIQPSEEYVFVRRDGTLFFAVAFSWENGALRYITDQGLRGTVAREALDLNATQQFNEQRGLNFRVPA
jgi:hypothetical protein